GPEACALPAQGYRPERHSRAQTARRQGAPQSGEEEGAGAQTRPQTGAQSRSAEREKSQEKIPLMDDKTRYEAGMWVRRATLGDAYVDQSLKARNDFNTDFQEFITRIAWGDVWTRPGLERKLRSIVVIVSTLSLGHWDEFRLHLRGALNN